MSFCCFLIIALWYSLLIEISCGIDVKFIWGLHPVSSSNGEGMFAVNGVHLYSMRPKFQGFFCRVEQSRSFFAIFTIASAKPLDWGKCGELVICCICRSFINSLNSVLVQHGPLSLLMMYGLPSCVMMLRISLQTADPVELGSFLTIKYLEK